MSFVSKYKSFSIGLFKVHVNSSLVTKTLRRDLNDFVRQMIVAVFTEK